MYYLIQPSLQRTDKALWVFFCLFLILVTRKLRQITNGHKLVSFIHSQPRAWIKTHLKKALRLLHLPLYYLLFTWSLQNVSLLSPFMLRPMLASREGVATASTGCSPLLNLHSAPWRVPCWWLTAVSLDIASQGSSTSRKSPVESASISVDCQEMKLVPTEHYTL